MSTEYYLRAYINDGRNMVVFKINADCTITARYYEVSDIDNLTEWMVGNKETYSPDAFEDAFGFDAYAYAEYAYKSVYKVYWNCFWKESDKPVNDELEDVAYYADLYFAKRHAESLIEKAGYESDDDFYNAVIIEQIDCNSYGQYKHNTEIVRVKCKCYE